MTKTDFRGSETTDFQRCPKRYDYAWVQNLEPKQRNEKLTIGSAIHKFLELLYSGKDVREAVRQSGDYIVEHALHMEHHEYVEMIDLHSAICFHYAQHYANCDWEVVAVEMPFRVHLEGHLHYTGTIDLLVKDKDGKYWLVDHKTTASLDIYDKNSDMDRQISRYWYAIERYMDIKIEGFIYNIILKDYPVPPKVLKNGSLSKDKAQRTNLFLYLQAIKDHKLNESDYEDFLDYLDQNPREFFRRLKVERNISELRASIYELQDVIHDIKDKHRNKRWYRNITKDCHWDCPFKTLCQAEMDGSNADHIRNELFNVKDVE